MSETSPETDVLTAPEESERPATESEPGTQVETPSVINKETYDKTVAGFQRKIARYEEEREMSARDREELASLRSELRNYRYQNVPAEQANQYKVQELEQENLALRSRLQAEDAKRRYDSVLADLEEEFPDGVSVIRDLAKDGTYLPVNTESDLEAQVRKFQTKYAPKSSSTPAQSERAVASNPPLEPMQGELSDTDFANLPLEEQRKRLGVAPLRD